MFALLIWTVCLLDLATSQTTDKICSWSQARAGTVQDALYIDGGDLERGPWENGQWLGSQTPPTGPSGNLYKFSYTKSYNFDSDCAFDWATLNTSLAEYLPLTNGYSGDAGNYWDGTMFVDDQELYTYGGFLSAPLPDGGPTPDYILEYELFPSPGQDKAWGERLPFSLDHAGINNHITHGAGVSAPSETLAFYFGGMHAPSWGPLSPYNPTQAANTLIQADLSSPGGITAQNISLPSDVETRASGQVVWVPRSKRGLLLAFGGVPYPPDLFSMDLSSDQASANREQGPRFMTTIPVYDVDSSAWYTQDTTGGPPPASMQFCSVVTTGDSTSFDIFAYGGYDGITGAASDDVWVLSVPAFHWVKVYDGTSTPLHARSGHACSLPYPDQMLVLGGTNLYNNGNSGTSCIQDGSIVDVFDLIQLKWTKKYDPSQWSTYSRSQVITNAIAGAAGAGSAVAALFSSEYGSSSKLPKWSAYKKTGHAGSCSKSSTPIGAIVGGVVGGVIVLAALALIWWLWTRNKKNRTKTRDRSNSESTTRHSRIAFWRNTVPPALPKDDMTDSTATEVDGPLTPPAHTDQMAELYGASFYAPRPSHQINEANAENGLQPHTSPALSSTTPRSPRSPPTGAAFVEAEAQDNTIHELHDAPKPSRLSQISSELGSTTNNYRNHPLYPWSVDGVPRRTNSDSTAPKLSQTSRGRHNSGSPPSPVTNPTRPELSSNGDAEGDETMTSASAQVHTAMAVPIRPMHNRNASSISSELPASPVMRQQGGRQGFDSKALKPISPLIQQGGEETHNDSDGRPKHARHGSSMSGIGLPSPAEGVEAGEDGIGLGIGNNEGTRESVKRKPVGGSSAYAEMMQRRAA